MKVILALVVLLTGCASYVRTYDHNGTLLGSCERGSYLLGFISLPFPGFNDRCYGSANPPDLGLTPEISTGTVSRKYFCPDGSHMVHGECR